MSVIGRLKGDTSQRPAKYVGAPSPVSDRGGLYRRKTVAEIVNTIERESLDLAPQRILVLYVPAGDARNLIAALNFVCFLIPLVPREYDLPAGRDTIHWRHEKREVEKRVYAHLQSARRSTNALKAEITDKRISALTLPARNFNYPDRVSTISSAYGRTAGHTVGVRGSVESLSPTRFTRDQLPDKAFRGRGHSTHLFQDERGRIFVPDLHHAPVRDNRARDARGGLSLPLKQRYRFGVTVRDGNLHYDVQYESPRRLQREPMYCAAEGDVWVTGSHANVGVNDVVWAPDGTKEPRQNK